MCDLKKHFSYSWYETTCCSFHLGLLGVEYVVTAVAPREQPSFSELNKGKEDDSSTSSGKEKMGVREEAVYAKLKPHGLLSCLIISFYNQN